MPITVMHPGIRIHLPWLLLLTILLSILWSEKLPAQSADGIDAASDIARLSDEEVRRRLLDSLQSTTQPVSAESFNPATLALGLQKSLQTVRARATHLMSGFAELPSLPGRWWEKMTHGRTGNAVLIFFSIFVITLIVGWLCARWMRYWLSGRIKKGIGKDSVDALSRSMQALARLGVELFMVAMTGVVATGAFFVFGLDDQRDRTLFFFLLAATLIVMVISAGSRVLFSPDKPERRIPSFNNLESSRFHRAIRITIFFAAFGFFACASFEVLGIVGPVHELLLVLVGTGTTMLLSWTIWSNRTALAKDITSGSDEPGLPRQLIASVWPYLFSVLPVLLWVSVVINHFLGGNALYGAALFTISLLFLLPIAEASLSRVSSALEARRRPTFAVVARIARLGLIVTAVLSLAAAWRINLFSVAATGFGTKAAQSLTQISSMAFICYAIWEIARVAINRKIDDEDEAYAILHGQTDMEMEQGGAGLSRTRTLLPLLRRSIAIVLVTMVVLGSLSALGVDTGPILAGAGVLGLAIGFGSQTLVRDIVTGFFFLMEDAFRIGEYIDVGPAKGTVEEISVRSMKLRHHRGALNTVPFGSVDVIKNFSRDWSIMKLRIRVPFETDLNKVRKLLKKVGQEMMEEEAIKDDFLQPFKAQGAVEVDDYGFVVSTKFMSKPGKQFYIRRFAFQAMQEAFEEEGIPFARPNLRVEIGDIDDPLGNNAVAQSALSSSSLSVQGAAGAAASVTQPKPGR